jgi:fructokinase
MPRARRGRLKRWRWSIWKGRNNAGISTWKWTDTMEYDEWRRTWELNLNAVHVCACTEANVVHSSRSIAAEVSRVCSQQTQRNASCHRNEMTLRYRQDGAMVTCIGESLIDFVPEGTLQNGSGLPIWKAVAGGSPFNCAIAAARLGAEVQFVGAVSTDMFGDHIVERLRAENVDVSLVKRVDLHSTLAFVKREANGAASYAFFAENGADRAFTLDMVPPRLPAGGALQFGSISLIADPAGRSILNLVARERNRRVVAFDPNIRPNVVTDKAAYRARLDEALEASSILKTSDEDLEYMYPGRSLENAVDAVMEKGVRIVIVTRGERGTEAYFNGRKTAAPAVPVEVADTIGAGDSFHAAILVWLNEHGVSGPGQVNYLTIEDIQEALLFATKVAAITCSRTGADPPRRQELPE